MTLYQIIDENGDAHQFASFNEAALTPGFGRGARLLAMELPERPRAYQRIRPVVDDETPEAAQLWWREHPDNDGSMVPEWLAPFLEDEIESRGRLRAAE